MLRASFLWRWDQARLTLTWVNAVAGSRGRCDAMARVYQLPRKWLPISSAPSDCDLELCVIDRGEVHALVFPCRKAGDGWIDASTKKQIDVQPTHWRVWNTEGG